MSDTISNDEVIERIRNSAKPLSKNNTYNFLKLKARMTSNTMSFYNDTDEEKDLILHHLDKKFIKVKSKEDIIIAGNKNLLYFSIFFSDAYVDLLYMCLKSIVANTPNINFDVLFITDASTKEKIEAFDIISNFNVDYMVTDSVDSGPLASIKKLNIFDYEKISNYSKILFFDADIICIKDLNIIFQQTLEPEKLYVCSTPNHRSPLLLAPTHGIMHLSKADAAFINENPDVVPFNAGQFLFLNSTRMQRHFSNIRWLRNAWPAEFFYEQSFMNYYFVLRSLTTPMSIKVNKQITETILNCGAEKRVTEWRIVDEQLVSVTHNPSKKANGESDLLDFIRLMRLFPGKKNIMTVSGAQKSNFSKNVLNKFSEIPEGILNEMVPMHTENTVAIHFAATLPDGVEKKTFINNYANAYKLHI